MKLSNIAQYFNRTKFCDAYSGVELGAGQLDVYDDSRRDGLTELRRVFEVASDTLMPPRLVIRFHGRNWLVGADEIDSFNGYVIRNKYILHEAEGLANLWTLPQILQDLQPAQAYASRIWVKSSEQVNTDSQRFNQLQIFTSRAETLAQGMLIELSGSQHIVRDVYPSSAGHQAAVCEELDTGAVETGTITVTSLDPVTEAPTTTSTPIKLVKLRWQTDFSYFSQATTDFERGDMQAVAMTSPVNGTVITLADGDWKVLATQSRNGVSYLHMRRSV